MYLRDHNLSVGDNASQISSVGKSPIFQWPSAADLEGATIEDDSYWRLTASEISAASSQQGIPKDYRNASPLNDLTRGPKSPLALQQESRQQILSPIVGLRDLDSTESLPNEGALEERMCKMLSTARSVGFESLDSMMLQYYTLPVKHNISLLEIQSRSRRRGLPKLLTLISKAFLVWPERETHGLSDALLASVELVIREEAQVYAADHSNRDQQERTDLPEGSKPIVESLRVNVSIQVSISFRLS